MDAANTDNLATVGSLGGVRYLFAQNTGLDNGALGSILLAQDGTTPNLPGLLAVALSRNPAVTGLDALAPCTGLRMLVCGDNPGLRDLSALSGMAQLGIVFLGKTDMSSISDLTALKGADLGGMLSLRENELLPATSACADIALVEGNGNSVDRDFACGPNEVAVTISVSRQDVGSQQPVPCGNAGTVLPFVGACPAQLQDTGVLEAVQTNPDYVFSHWAGDVVGTERTKSAKEYYRQQAQEAQAMWRDAFTSKYKAWKCSVIEKSGYAINAAAMLQNCEAAVDPPNDSCSCSANPAPNSSLQRAIDTQSGCPRSELCNY